ncbi:unnamed protein product [Meloidogyne enterolobii]|uniref:Uncharacterized protein n=1 Tax=Meloidogyne enterolobii TaxID=390850 RepID=A0ACB1BAB5_MELEN
MTYKLSNLKLPGKVVLSLNCNFMIYYRYIREGQVDLESFETARYGFFWKKLTGNVRTTGAYIRCSARDENGRLICNARIKGKFEDGVVKIYNNGISHNIEHPAHHFPR